MRQKGQLLGDGGSLASCRRGYGEQNCSAFRWRWRRAALVAVFFERGSSEWYRTLSEDYGRKLLRAQQAGPDTAVVVWTSAFPAGCS